MKCPNCKGEGKTFGLDKCQNCDGTGKVDEALEAAVAEEARMLLNFLYPYIKGNLFDADVARAKIRKALWDGVSRGRREEREAHDRAIEQHNAKVEAARLEAKP